jgi:hypothetical protein
MKRIMKCKTCGTKKNSATGQPLYILGEANTLVIHDPIGECWDCGETRREREAKRLKRKAKRQKARGVEQSGSSHGS